MLYEQHHNAREKYDYFVLGISVAVTGFLGSQLQPGPLASIQGVLELSSLLLFAGSAWAGVRRLEHGIVYTGTQFMFVDETGRASRLSHLLGSGDGE